MNSFLRILLLIVAVAGFVVFLSFHAENIGPKRTVTIGINASPWFKHTQVAGLGDLGKKTEVNFLSWSAAGLLAAVAALFVRSQLKGR